MAKYGTAQRTRHTQDLLGHRDSVRSGAEVRVPSQLSGDAGFSQLRGRANKSKLPAPDYSTVNRRQGSFAVPLLTRKRPRHVVIDATGLKVYGAGE